MNRVCHLACVWTAFFMALDCAAAEGGKSPAQDGASSSEQSGTKERIVPQVVIDHVERGDYAAAMPYYREAVRKNPESGESHCGLGGLLLNAKQYDEAIVELQEAIRLDPNNTRFHRLLGWAFATKDERERSLQQFETAIQLSPDEAANWVELGKFYHLTGDFPHSVDAFTKALDIQDSTETRMMRASTYRRNRQFKEAIADCDQALADSPDDFRFLTCRAFCRMRTYDVDGASQDAERVIARREATANVGYLVRGCVHYSRGEFDAALSDLSMSIELAPREPLAYVIRAVVHISHDRMDDAMSDLDDAIKLSSNPQRLNYELDGFGWQVYKFRGLLRTCFAKRHQEAIADLNQAIELNSGDSECFTLRGIAHANALDMSSARAEFMKAIEIRQDDDLASFTLINLLIGSPDEKERDGKRAIELAKGLNVRHPNQPAVLAHLAGAYSEAAEFEKAVAVQSQAVELLKAEGERSTFSTSIWWGSTYNFHFSVGLGPNQRLLDLYQQKKPFRLAGNLSATAAASQP
jgi:tetratricopeptide (TPR) repeat protein